MSWLYGRPTEHTVDFIASKFAKRPEIVEANTRAFLPATTTARRARTSSSRTRSSRRSSRPGVYRQITGNTALAYGLIAASVKSGLDLFLGAYPITPASSILEELARHKAFGVRTFQAEDEIAAAGRRARGVVRRRARRVHLAGPGSCSRPRRSASASCSSCRC